MKQDINWQDLLPILSRVSMAFPDLAEQVEVIKNVLANINGGNSMVPNGHLRDLESAMANDLVAAIFRNGKALRLNDRDLRAFAWKLEMLDQLQEVCGLPDRTIKIRELKPEFSLRSCDSLITSEVPQQLQRLLEAQECLGDG